jgi:hypothetical protein
MCGVILLFLVGHVTKKRWVASLRILNSDWYPMMVSLGADQVLDDIDVDSDDEDDHSISSTSSDSIGCPSSKKKKKKVPVGNR